MEEIWWRQVTNARKFREEIQDEIFDLNSIVTVSYTHLTLPTILLV